MKRAETGSDKALWSVVDLATDIILFLKLSMLWWQLIRYFGDGHLAVQLKLAGLSLAAQMTVLTCGGWTSPIRLPPDATPDLWMPV
jgi:hypothetical protein